MLSKSPNQWRDKGRLLNFDGSFSNRKIQKLHAMYLSFTPEEVNSAHKVGALTKGELEKVGPLWKEGNECGALGCYTTKSYFYEG